MDHRIADVKTEPEQTAGLEDPEHFPRDGGKVAGREIHDGIREKQDDS